MGLTQPLKMITRDFSWGKGGQCLRLTTYHLHVLIVNKSGGLNLLKPCGPVQACNGTAFFFYYIKRRKMNNWLTMIYYRKDKFNVIPNYAFCLENACESGRNFKCSIRDGQVVCPGPGKKSVRYLNTGEWFVPLLSEICQEYMKWRSLPVTESRWNT